MILAKKTPVWFLITTAKRDMFLTTLFTLTLLLLHLQHDFFAMPISISALLGTTIALILSFQLSQSYERWWEARTIWGAIVNDSRSLVLQVKHFAADETEAIKTIAKMQIVWVDTFAHMLRGEATDEQYLRRYLTDEQASYVRQAKHPALALNDLINAAIQQLNIDSYKKMQLDATQVRLVESMGASERIKNTVFPREYPFYLHVTIYLFLAFMSVSLANLGHHWEILMILVIAAPFFLLEKAAEHLQDPFEGRPTDVPISAIARNIEINILSLLEAEEIPEPLAPQSFYIN